MQTAGGNGTWRAIFMWLVPLLLGVLSVFILAYGTWNYGEVQCLRDEIRYNRDKKLDKEQYYRDITQIDKKLDDIYHLVQAAHKRITADNE